MATPHAKINTCGEKEWVLVKRVDRHESEKLHMMNEFHLGM